MSHTSYDLDNGRYSTDQMLKAICDDAHQPRFSANVPDEQYPSHGLNVTVDRPNATGPFLYTTYSTGSGNGMTKHFSEPGQITAYVRAAVPEGTTWQREN